MEDILGVLFKMEDLLGFLFVVSWFVLIIIVPIVVMWTIFSLFLEFCAVDFYSQGETVNWWKTLFFTIIMWIGSYLIFFLMCTIFLNIVYALYEERQYPYTE